MARQLEMFTNLNAVNKFLREIDDDETDCEILTDYTPLGMVYHVFYEVDE
ncbi:hypothetical protein LA429_10460 [Weissella cibaria]|nr:hypothetical protein [Weissella cibaria]MCC6123130.1 hypothetical protein [Weissella cibaria]